MKTKYTQGNWKWFRFMTSFNGLPFPHLNVAITHPDEDNICCLTVSASKIEEAEANAKLIAAAPDLLEALIKAKELIKGWHNMTMGEDLWATYENKSQEMQPINDAIKKAIDE